MLKEYRTLVPYMRRYAWYYVGGLISLAVTSGAQLFIPVLIEKAIDTIGTDGFALRVVGIVALQLVLVAFVVAAGRLGWRFWIQGASRRIEAELRANLFDHLLKLSPSFYGRTSIGDLMARNTNDMMAIRMAAGMALVALFDGIFMMVAILIILFTRYPAVALYTVIPLPIITILILGAGKFIGPLFRRVQEGFSKVSETAQESITGVAVIKSYAKEDYFAEKFRAVNQEYQDRNMQLVRLFGLLFPLVTFFAGFTSFILLRLGGVAAIGGALTIGQIVGVFTYLMMLVWPMLGAGFTVNLIQRGAASLARINAILAEEPEIRSRPDARRGAPKGDIEVRNLTFAYTDDETKVLDGVSVFVPHGSTLGILGRTGAGKSTFIKLLPRLLNPPPGTVFIDGIDILDYEVGDLRKAFGLVPQDSFLFSDSLKGNIAFGIDRVDEAIVRDVAELSTMSRDLRLFPHGFETEVGERGITLSGGQKQRVSISRALAVDPEILIFDDALSAVDTETEEKILTGLLERRRGRTNILVSHRVSTLSHADQIMVIEHGRVIQEGSHAELVTQDGEYREVWLLQQLEHAKET